MFIVNHRKIFYSISIILAVASIIAISLWGLRPSIDFTGGSLLSVSFPSAQTGEVERPDIAEVNAALSGLGLGDVSVRPSGDGYILRLKEISQEQKGSILESLSVEGRYAPVEKTFSNIGPTLGKEAIQKSWISIILVLLAIILFIAFAFRKVSYLSGGQAKPVSSWVYGLVTILALTHDVLIPTGLFAVLGHFHGFEVDTLFVTALLVILGFSVHDTIVVFDRVRENLRREEEYGGKKSFDEVVGQSVSETITRSVNTSLTTLLAILALYIFGPESIRNFNLALLAGISIGTYSSIFIASTLLVTINNWKKGHAQK